MNRVLVLDDNAEMVTMLRLVLQQQGFEVFTGRSGEEGLKILHNLAPMLIISSLSLAKMDGLAFLDAVRANPEWSTSAFVMTGSQPTNEQRWAAIEHGADAFLAKPFRFDELQKILYNLGVMPARA